LARSATGQPITAYSSHFHGPRDEKSELHIVLVDNGRSELLGSPDFRRSLNCIRCGACMNTCPVYRRTGGHSYDATIPGPIGSILNPAMNIQKYESLPYACSLCGSCTDVCPVKINLHEQLYTFRQRVANKGLLSPVKSLGMKVGGFVLKSDRLYALSGKIGRLALRWLPRWAIYNPLNPWGRQRDLPPAPQESFRDMYRRRSEKKE
ncbi:MAG TPA: 4Fe-4S dicluster domain-containing protein, partial [Planctomicrobium sp.]|nr:4Fe-4S dicluster domain-containing protein [Planctomicrobium sp.]